MFKHYLGYIYEGHTFVVNKSDIINATDDQFVPGTALLSCNHGGRVIETGKISDGYHTFDELYHHRAVLFSVICNQNPNLAWKSKFHGDGTMYYGMFIVGIETPEGQATYHYDTASYWDMFRVRELKRAPKWDGHTPDEAIRRIGLLASDKT